MFSSFERLIALRYLRSGKRERVVSVIAGFSFLGVALGVAALIVVMAVMNGFHKEISSKMTGFNGDVEVTSYKGSIDNYQQLVDKIKQVEEVNIVTPLIIGQVMSAANGFAYGAVVKGVKVEDLKQRALIANNIYEGDIESLQDSNNIMLGKELAENLRVMPGDLVKLISPQGTSTVIGMVPRTKDFKVSATFKADMYQYDSTTIFMPLKMAQIYFRLKDKVTSLEVMIKDPQQSTIVAAKIAALLGDGYRVVDWQTLNAPYFKVLKTERVVMFIILTLIIIVAAFNIISSLIMLVKDKAVDIAILRTMGATRAMILRIFILCGSLVGVIGTLTGVGLGLFIATNIERVRKLLEKVTGGTIFDPLYYYLSALPSDVQFSDVLNVAVLSLLLSIAATIIPARKAASLEPIEGIRND